jgi:hypothetical protein
MPLSSLLFREASESIPFPFTAFLAAVVGFYFVQYDNKSHFELNLPLTSLVCSIFQMFHLQRRSQESETLSVNVN